MLAEYDQNSNPYGWLNLSLMSLSSGSAIPLFRNPLGSHPSGARRQEILGNYIKAASFVEVDAKMLQEFASGAF
jgi:hypothetical protein